MKRLRTITFLLGLGVLLALGAGCPAPGSGGTAGIPPGTTVYVGGRYYIVSGPSVPCYWANGVRTDLPTGGASLGGYVSSIFVDQGVVYAAGYYNNTSISMPCTWVNGVKTDLPTPGSVSGEAKSIYISGGNVYVCGSHSGYPEPCVWVNGIRTDLSTGFSNEGNANSIYVANSHVYVGGYYYNGSGYSIPCYWVDGLKIDLPIGSMASAGAANSIFVSGGSVCLAGSYTDASTTDQTPSVWINSVLTPLSPSANFLNLANSVFSSSGKVYVGGMVNSGDITGCYWVDGARTDISECWIVNGIFVFGGNVYMAGGYGSLGSEIPGLWMNSTRIELSLPSGSSEGSATSVFVE